MPPLSVIPLAVKVLLPSTREAGGVRLLPIWVSGLLLLALWIDTANCLSVDSTSRTRMTEFSVYLSVVVPPVVKALAGRISVYTTIIDLSNVTNINALGLDLSG